MTKKYIPFILLCWAFPAFESHAVSIGEFCGNIKVNENIVCANCSADSYCTCNDAVHDRPSCQKGRFTCDPTHIDTDRCVDDIDLNISTGKLECATYKLPKGSWAETCINGKIVTKHDSESYLTANCYPSKGNPVPAILDLRTCEVDDVGNYNGKLKCAPNKIKDICGTKGPTQSSNKE